MKNIVEYNTLKKLKLMENILKSKGDYNLICIDVDDVIFNTDPFVQTVLENIDHRATKKYREEISHESSEDTRELLCKSFDILDAILEENLYIDYDDEKEKITRRNYNKINYDEIYVDENLIPGAVEYVRNILENRGKNDFVIFLSHKNPEREGIIKAKRLYELFPTVDAVETIPFHIEPGTKNVSSKALWIKQVYGLDNLSNCYLIDNSKNNCIDFRKHGGYDIRYLPEKFNNNHTLADHMSKLDCLDPYMIQFIISYIKYARENPNYVDILDVKLDDVKDKVKKI